MTNLKKSLGTVYIFAHVHVLLLGVTDDGFCPRKWVYMMGFMHCVLAGKTGNMGWVFFGMIVLLLFCPGAGLMPSRPTDKPTRS